MGRSRIYTAEESKENRKIYARNWRKNNPDKAKKSIENWNKNNPDKRKEIMAVWRKNNSDKTKQDARNWRKNNPDKAKKSVENWNKNNPDKIKKIKGDLIKRQVDNLADSYVLSLLKKEKVKEIENKEILKTLTETKRNIMLLKRTQNNHARQ